MAAAYGAGGGVFPILQSLDNSCVIASVCNLIYLKTGKIVSEAYAASKIALYGGFSVMDFKTTGISMNGQFPAVKTFLAEYGVDVKLSAITGRNVGESNLSSSLSNGEPFVVRESIGVSGGHAVVMQYDAAASNFRVIDSQRPSKGSGCGY